MPRGSGKHAMGGRPEGRRAAMADSATLEDRCHPKKLFVGGLVHETTTQNLREYFGRFGTVVDAVVLRWPDGRSRGFGYVTFAEASAVAAALKEKHQFGGRDVDVKRAVPGTNKLFVGGLPQSAGGAELREHFEAFGVVSDAVVMIDPATGRSRGFGFVCFLPGPEGAAAVASALEQYKSHQIRGKWVEVKSAAPPHKLAVKDGQEGPSHLRPCKDAQAKGSSTIDSLPSAESLAASPLATVKPPAPPGLHMGAGWAPCAPPPPPAALWPPMLSTEAPTLLPRHCPLPPGLELPGAKAARPADSSEPVKVSVPQPLDSWLSGREQRSGLFEERPGLFEASGDLQRSLEQLLRLQVGQGAMKGLPEVAEAQCAAGDAGNRWCGGNGWLEELEGSVKREF